MPHRKLNVENQEWDVWDVRPEARPHRLGILENGWLCFQSGETRKRLHPIPEGWDRVTDDRLVDLFDRAVAVSPARKVPGKAEPSDAFRTINTVRDDREVAD